MDIYKAITMGTAKGINTRFNPERGATIQLSFSLDKPCSSSREITASGVSDGSLQSELRVLQSMRKVLNDELEVAISKLVLDLTGE